MSRLHREDHNVDRIGWLRAAVLGANDGLVSTASLILGVAAAGAATSQILIAGTAGLTAGAMSMAAGEYVSVSSQSDTENADIARERQELIDQPDFELKELAATFVARGVEQNLADRVAEQLTAKDALSAHAREELGITHISTARPIQAAFVSALTVAAGAALPLLVVLVAPAPYVVQTVSLSALLFLGMLGALGAQAGGANIWKGTARVMFWGAIAMAVTAGVGAYFGAVV
jgi:VIT1/CCC1 family predicted Fe2+/Mn2+ transporter